MYITVRPRKKQNSRTKRAFSRQKATRPEVRQDVNRWEDWYILWRAVQDTKRWQRAKKRGEGLM